MRAHASTGRRFKLHKERSQLAGGLELVRQQCTAPVHRPPTNRYKSSYSSFGLTLHRITANSLLLRYVWSLLKYSPKKKVKSPTHHLLDVLLGRFRKGIVLFCFLKRKNSQKRVVIRVHDRVPQAGTTSSIRLTMFLNREWQMEKA